MMFWPVAVAFDTITDFIYPKKEIIGLWHCEIEHLWTFYGMTSPSFITDSLQNACMVCFERVRDFGKQKTKQIFLGLSMLVALILAF
jgi:hypothetical protein